MQRLLVMLPALNEFKAVRRVVDRIPRQELTKLGFETKVLLLDGGSSDGTPRLATDLGCEVIVQNGKGKGTGMRQGFGYFLEHNYDVLVMLDADGTYDSREMPRLLHPLSSHDIILGNRLKGRIQPSAMTRFNWIGNHLLTWFAVSLYGMQVSDLCTGYWAFNRRAIELLQLNSIRFEIEAEMYTSAVHQGLSLGEVPISYAPRIGDAKLGSVKDGTSIARKLIIRRFFPVPYEEINGEI